MSLKPDLIGPVPPETARVAKTACPKGSTFIQMRDELGVLFQDEMFADLFPKDVSSTRDHGFPALLVLSNKIDLWQRALPERLRMPPINN